MTESPDKRRSSFARRLRSFVVIIGLLVGVASIFVVSRMGAVYRHPVVAMKLLTSSAEPALPVPVQGVRPRQLADTWGGPRSGGRKHRGIDIFAERGTPIISATRGIVATVGTNRLGGRIVRVLGPGGEWHYYAHLEGFADVREGQLIAAGTVLGYVGDSGNAKGTPPHLHYGIYRMYGQAMNPYPRLTGSARL